MKEYTSDHLRNIALVGHGGTGKTSLAESLLFTGGATTRLGKVEDGNTMSDYHPDEVERRISINSSLLHTEWNGNKINILDTPGYLDFTGEVKACLRVADLAVVLLKSFEGVEVGTEIVTSYAEQLGTPMCVLVNKVDHENSGFDKVVSQAKEMISHDCVPVQFPASQGTGFDAVIDVVRMKLLRSSPGGDGTLKEEDIPIGMKGRADELRQALTELVAESNEDLLDKYLEAGGLTDEEFLKGFRAGIRSRKVFPILCASATTNVGVSALLDFLVDYAPSPVDRGEARARVPGGRNGSGAEEVLVNPDSAGSPSLFVFKTVSEEHVGELSFFRAMSGVVKPGLDLLNEMNGKPERLAQIYVMSGKDRKDIGKLEAGDLGAVVKLKDTHTNDTLSGKSFPVVYEPINFPDPVYHAAIVPKTKGDEDKIATGLHALHQEDPTFLFRVDGELHQTIVSGQGELHLDIIVRRLRKRFHVEVDLAEPRVPYRETIRGVAKDAEYKHKKQTGGHGQYGHVHLRLEPVKQGQGFEFVDEIVGGVVPNKFIPAVEKGVVEAMKEGPLAGYPVVDVRVALHYGSYHDVDSSEMAFKIAAAQAFKKGFLAAKPVLLEPISLLEVKVPEDAMGEVMGDISGRRGKIMGIETSGHYQIVKAHVPASNLHKYATILRSRTGGRGIFKATMSHYEEVPQDQVQKIIEAAEKKEQEA